MPRCTHRPRYLPKQQSTSPSAPPRRGSRSATKKAKAEEADDKAARIALLQPTVVKNILTKVLRALGTGWTCGAGRPFVAMWKTRLWKLWPARGAEQPVVVAIDRTRHGEEAMETRQWKAQWSAESVMASVGDNDPFEGRRYIVQGDEETTIPIDLGSAGTST